MTMRHPPSLHFGLAYALALEEQASFVDSDGVCRDCRFLASPELFAAACEAHEMKFLLGPPGDGPHREAVATYYRKYTDEGERRRGFWIQVRPPLGAARWVRVYVDERLGDERNGFLDVRVWRVGEPRPVEARDA